MPLTGLKKRTGPQQEAPSDPREDKTVQARSWTHGHALGAKIGYLLVIIALISGPASAVYAAFQIQGIKSAVATELAQSQEGRPLGPQLYVEAGQLGQAVVQAWLSATSEEHSWLTSLVGAAPEGLPQEPTDYKAVRITSISSQGSVWSVGVAASLRQGTNSEETAGHWERAYFEVPVWVSTAGEVSAVTLPAAVGPPDPVEPASLGFDHPISGSGEVTNTVGSFLTALLTGKGDVARYVSPGSTVRALSEPVWSGITVQQVLTSDADGAVMDSPDGQQLTVLVQAQLQRPGGSQLPTSYLIDLTSRSGRWEISGLQAVTALSGQETT